MAERAALYARVSTARQEEEQTVASQVAALHKAAAELGLQVPPQHCYVDEGFSGTPPVGCATDEAGPDTGVIP